MMRLKLAWQGWWVFAAICGLFGFIRPVLAYSPGPGFPGTSFDATPFTTTAGDHLLVDNQKAVQVTLTTKHPQDQGGAPVYLLWSPTVTGVWTFSCTSAFAITPNYEPLLSIWQAKDPNNPGAINNVNYVASNDITQNNGANEFNVSVTANQRYILQIDGKYDGTAKLGTIGGFTLNWRLVNDNFVNQANANTAIVLGSTGSSMSGLASSDGVSFLATSESTEAAGVWYQWVCPGDTDWIFSTTNMAPGTGAGPQMDIYKVPNGSLVTLGAALANPVTRSSASTQQIPGKFGDTYLILVHPGFYNFSLSWNIYNDSFNNPQPIDDAGTYSSGCVRYTATTTSSWFMSPFKGLSSQWDVGGGYQVGNTWDFPASQLVTPQNASTGSRPIGLSTAGATMEAKGETKPPGGSGTSVWFVWAAPVHASSHSTWIFQADGVQMGTQGQPNGPMPDTAIAVYAVPQGWDGTITGLGAAVAQDHNWASLGQNVPNSSRVQFTLPGKSDSSVFVPTQYYIQVDGAGTPGDFILSWRVANDNIDDAIRIGTDTSPSGSSIDSNTDCTIQTKEQANSHFSSLPATPTFVAPYTRNDLPRATLWYKWIAPSSFYTTSSGGSRVGTVTITTTGSVRFYSSRDPQTGQPLYATAPMDTAIQVFAIDPTTLSTSFVNHLPRLPLYLGSGGATEIKDNKVFGTQPPSPILNYVINDDDPTNNLYPNPGSDLVPVQLLNASGSPATDGSGNPILGSATQTSLVTFHPTTGSGGAPMVYYIAVDCQTGYEGDVHIHVGDDAFADAQVIQGPDAPPIPSDVWTNLTNPWPPLTPYVEKTNYYYQIDHFGVLGDDTVYSRETGEPNNAGNTLGPHSAWFQWTSHLFGLSDPSYRLAYYNPASHYPLRYSGSVNFRLASVVGKRPYNSSSVSNIDVYQGSSVGGLTQVYGAASSLGYVNFRAGWNLAQAANPLTGALATPASGVQYMVGVDSAAGDVFQLAWDYLPPPLLYDPSNPPSPIPTDYYGRSATPVTVTPHNGSVTITWVHDPPYWAEPNRNDTTWDGYTKPALSSVYVSYIIKRSTTSGSSPTDPYQTVATGIRPLPYITHTDPSNPVKVSYTVTGLKNGTKYYFVISSYNSGGESFLDSAEFSGTPNIQAPAAPPVATAGAGQVSVTWPAAEVNAMGQAPLYNLYRDTSATGSFSLKVASYVSGLSYVDTSVSNGITYYYKVTSIDSTGESDLSAVSNPATPVAGSTAVVSNLAAVAGWNSTSPASPVITLTWTPMPGALGYTLYRSTSPGTQPISANLVSTTTLPTYVDTTSTLVSGTTYYYVVTVQYATGSSGVSNQASASLQILPPTGVVAMSGNSQVQLTWNRASGAVSYNIHRSNQSGGNDDTASSFPVNIADPGSGSQVVWTDDGTHGEVGPANNSTYYYWITSVDGGGNESVRSYQVTGRPYLPPPTSVQAKSGNAMVTLTWQAAPGVTHYNVRRALYVGAPFVTINFPVIDSTLAAGTSYVDTNVLNGRTYYYVVTSVGQDPVLHTWTIESAYSTPVVSATPSWPPAQVVGVQASWGVSSVTVTWQPRTGAASYNVKRSTSPTGPFTTVNLSPVMSASFIDNTAVSGVTYYYVVTGVNAGGEGPPSSPPASAVPVAHNVPAAPSYVNATSGKRSISITWSASSGAILYRVRRGVKSGGPYIMIGATQNLHYTDTAVIPGVEYYYVVTALNFSGESAVVDQTSAKAQP